MKSHKVLYELGLDNIFLHQLKHFLITFSNNSLKQKQQL